MRFYIATTLTRAADHNRVRDALIAHGHSLTYDWTDHGSVKNQGQQRLCEVGLAEMEGVRQAQFLVVLLPGKRGTHTEMGMGLAWGKPVILHAPDEHGFMAPDERTCAFYHVPQVIPFTGTFDRFVELCGVMAAPLETA